MENNFYIYKATVVDVYDGDSWTLVVDLGFDISFKMKLRLNRIDTPELRGEERPEGLRVAEIVREKVLNQQIVIESYKDRTGKYGRYLADVYLDGININNWLLENGLANPYIG